jgi:membrane protease YdiL (CAAX protease family)
MRVDIAVRLLPFAAAYVVAFELLRQPRWLGFALGDLHAQLLFAAIASPVLFTASAAVQLWLTRRRGALRVPAGPADAWFQAGFYAVNGPIEEAFFRGLMQGGLGAAFGGPIGFAVATSLYVLYHRLGRWPWADVLATTLLGVPLGLAFWLLPGPPSLLGVSIAHIAATCGFLGPGPYLLKKLRVL